VIRTFARQIRSGQPVTITDERMTRYWISMEEATLFLTLMAVLPDASRLGLLDIGAPVQLRRLAEDMWGQLRPGTEFRLVTMGMRPGERLHEKLIYEHETISPSSSPGILAVRDIGVRPSASHLLLKLEGLRGAVRQRDSLTLRGALFDLVREGPDALLDMASSS